MPRRPIALCLLLAACEPSAPPTTPEPDDTIVEETVHAEQAEMTLSVREVSQEGWSGRLVVASFSDGRDRHIRVVPSDAPRPLQEIVAGDDPSQPFAAIDGGFYDRDRAPMGLVRTGGRDVHPAGARGGSGVFLVEGGAPRIVHVDDYRGGERVTEALQSIDRLVDGGQSLIGPGATDRRAARSAIAIDADGDVHLAVAFDERAVAQEADARIEMGGDATRTGPTIAQWAELLRRPRDQGGVGARQALGLDGGLSTSLVVKSEARSLSIVPYNATINALVVSVNEE